MSMEFTTPELGGTMNLIEPPKNNYLQIQSEHTTCFWVNWTN